MSEDPFVAQELAELADIAQVPVERIGYLSGLTADDLHVFRRAVTVRLHDQYSADYRRLGRLVRFLPKGFAARMGVKYLPPRILGRAAGPVFQDRPARYLTKMTDVAPTIVADAAAFMDPRTIGAVAAQIPTSSRELVNDIMDELIRRDDLATIDRMLLYLDDDQEMPGGLEAPLGDR